MEAALTARSLRNIKSELSFLLDSSVLSAEIHNDILHLLSSVPALSETTTPSIQLTQAKVESNDSHSLFQTQPNRQPSPLPPPYQDGTTHAMPIRNTKSPVPPPPRSQELARARALYTFAVTDKGDLGLSEGDELSVTEYTNDEWWKGKNLRTGEMGIFPKTYVEIMDSAKGGKSGIMPMDVASSAPGRNGEPSKAQQHGKSIGKKFGNAAIFGAGATVGSSLVGALI